MQDKALSVGKMFDEALRHHNAGRLTEAEALYRRVLNFDGSHADAMNWLGVLAFQCGRSDAAIELIRRAIALDGGRAQFHHHLAVVLESRGKAADAAVSYGRAIALKSDFAEAHANLGVLLQQQGRPQEAIVSYRRALVVRPNEAVTHFNLALTLQNEGQRDEAARHYERAIALKADLVEAHCNFGSLLVDLGRIDEGIASYDRALTYRPDHVLSHYKRGFALQRQGRREEALEAYDRVIKLKPDFAEALNNRGLLLRDLNRFDQALASFDRALEVEPEHIEALVNKGNTLLMTNRPTDAIASFNKALARRPDDQSTLVNRATTLMHLGRLDEALADYRRVLSHTPDHAEAHWGEGLCLLRAGDFVRGWRAYEWRWRAPRTFTQPLWLGEEDLTGKTILLYAEQGYGDTVQFSRYVPLVAGRGARVVLEVQPPLRRLMASLTGVAEVHACGDALPATDLQCPLMSLPLAFGTTLETVPTKTPYLSVPPALTAKWRAKVEGIRGPRIGLAWSTAQLYGHHRSVPPAALAPLLECGVQLVSLQKEYRPEDRAWLAAHPEVADFSADLEDFADTAALASLMAAVISTDTSVAHLAGALGLPLHILLSSIGCWRWLMERTDSPWYPTARLYRQSVLHEWSTPITSLAERLRSSLRSP